MVKILGISGSPRKASTYHALEIALQAAASKGGVETELISLKGKKIEPCRHCNYCKKNDSLCCIDDYMKELYPKIEEADAFIFASPVYLMNISPHLQALFSRLRPLHKNKGGSLRDKLAAGIAVGGTRNGGQETTLSAIIHSCLAKGIIFIGNKPGNYSGAMLWSKDQGAKGVDHDVIGCESLKNLGNRLAEVALIMGAVRNSKQADF